MEKICPKCRGIGSTQKNKTDRLGGRWVDIWRCDKCDGSGEIPEVFEPAVGQLMR